MIGVASRPLALLFRLYLGHPTDTRIYTFALVGGVKRLLALVLLLFRFNTQTPHEPNTLLTLTYTLTQTRINQYRRQEGVNYIKQSFLQEGLDRVVVGAVLVPRLRVELREWRERVQEHDGHR